MTNFWGAARSVALSSDAPLSGMDLSHMAMDLANGTLTASAAIHLLQDTVPAGDPRSFTTEFKEIRSRLIQLLNLRVQQPESAARELTPILQGISGRVAVLPTYEVSGTDVKEERRTLFATFRAAVDYSTVLLFLTQEWPGSQLRKCQSPACGRFFLAVRQLRDDKPASGVLREKYCGDPCLHSVHKASQAERKRKSRLNQKAKQSEAASRRRPK